MGELACFAAQPRLQRNQIHLKISVFVRFHPAFGPRLFRAVINDRAHPLGRTVLSRLTQHGAALFKVRNNILAGTMAYISKVDEWSYLPAENHSRSDIHKFVEG